ncbi:MAG: DUF4304 domain-containing protein [Phycisphaerae bacterium]
MNVQASMSNIGPSGKFTLNLGLFFPKVAELLGDTALADRPHEYDCTWRKRIGELMSCAQDHWWRLDPATDRILLARQVGDAWEQSGRPWIERLASPDEAKKEIIEARQFRLAAAFALLVGLTDQARDLIQRELVTTRNPHYLATVRAWAAQHGLT